MKKWKCPACAREKITEDNIVMVICKGCVDVAMDEIISPYNRIYLKPQTILKGGSNGNTRHT